MNEGSRGNQMLIHDERNRLLGVPGNRSAELLVDHRMATVEALGAFAADGAIELAGVAVVWLLAQPAVSSVIVGASAAVQVRVDTRVAPSQRAGEDLRTRDRALHPRPPKSETAS